MKYIALLLAVFCILGPSVSQASAQCGWHHHHRGMYGMNGYGGMNGGMNGYGGNGMGYSNMGYGAYSGNGYNYGQPSLLTRMFGGGSVMGMGNNYGNGYGNGFGMGNGYGNGNGYRWR